MSRIDTYWCRNTTATVAPKVGLYSTKRRAPVSIICVPIITFIPRQQITITTYLDAILPWQKQLFLAFTLTLSVLHELKSSRNVTKLTKHWSVLQNYWRQASIILNTDTVSEVSLLTLAYSIDRGWIERGGVALKADLRSIRFSQNRNTPCDCCAYSSD